MTRLVDKSLVGVRFLVLVGASLAAVGVIGHTVGWPMLTAALGPTAYVFAGNPASARRERRNAIIGHAVAVLVALACLAVFGVWSHLPPIEDGHLNWAQVGAVALAAGLSLGVLEMLDVHHAPAAATAILVSSGLARPGRPLYALLAGLAILIAVGPELCRLLPLGRDNPDPGE